MNIDDLLTPLQRPEVADLLFDADLSFPEPSRRAQLESELTELLGKVFPEGSVRVLAVHGSGALLAVWHRDPSATLADCPVVWIDSDGSPADTLARTFDEFLRMVPYGGGALYDRLVFARDRLGDNLKTLGWGPEKIEEAAARHQREDEEAAALLGDWMDAGIALDPAPLDTITRALREARFATWVQSLPSA